MLDVVILENTLSISMDLRTNSWDYIALLVGYKSTTEHVRDSDCNLLNKIAFWAADNIVIS